MIMNSILNEIKKSNKIAITFHTSPDGDSLGSSLALLSGLASVGKDVYISCMDDMPEVYSFLPFSQFVKNSTGEISTDTKCVIVLDCGDKKRINTSNINFTSRKYSLINIDHHLSNELYGDLNYVDTNASSVGEIVYQMLNLLDIEITKEIAACIYTSIITDSGSFRYSGTTSVTHSIAGDLINTGIDFSEIHRIVFENKKFESLKLLGRALSSMELIDESICAMYVTKEMLNDLHLGCNIDTSYLISAAMQTDTAESAVLFKECDEGIKISLRSKSKVDVRKIAEKFGGGGHTRAAGILLNNYTLNEAKDAIIKEIENELV